MPRDRTYWNVLEAHIRSNPHDLLGMNSSHGANELRKVALLVARYAKINKGRDKTINYMIKRLTLLHKGGFIEALNFDARESLCSLTVPVWNQLDWKPIELSDLVSAGE